MAWFDHEQQQSAASAMLATGPGPAVRPTYSPISEVRPAASATSPAETYAPPDERILTRADFQHVMLQTAMGGNYLAPIDEPRYILDVGCGSGRWAWELAQRFPGSRVVGIDITPPSLDGVTSGVHGQRRPENLVFQQANVLEGLPFAASTFNFVHQRLLGLAIPQQRWPGIVRELVRLTHPGGWVELLEGGLVRNGGPALETLQHWITALAYRRGIDPRAGRRVGDLLHGAGLHRIVAHDFELPVGSHGGRFGELMAGDFLARVEQLRPLVISGGLAAPYEYDHFLAALTGEMASSSYMQPFHVAYGQR